MATEAKKSSLHLLGEILWNPVSKAIGTVVGAWGWFKAFQPPDVEQQLTLYSLLHNAWPWWLWTIVVLSIFSVVVLYGGVTLAAKQRKEADRQLNELHDRIAVLEEPKALDVWLEGPVANTFTLHARGDASEIRVGPIVTESAIYGTMKDGERTMRTATPRHAIEFRVVSDLHDGEKQPMVPVLFFGEDDPRHPRSVWPENEATKPALVKFLYNAKFLRSRENGEPDFRTISEAEMDAIAERRQEPFHFSFDITFWDSEHNEPWKRAELLVHEPDTKTTFVRRVGRPERLVAGAGARP